MKPLTLQEAKDKVARELPFPFKDWQQLETTYHLHYDIKGLVFMMECAAQLFGDSQWNQAIEKAIKISENRQDESTDNAEYLGHLKVIEELKRLKR